MMSLRSHIRTVTETASRKSPRAVVDAQVCDIVVECREIGRNWIRVVLTTSSSSIRADRDVKLTKDLLCVVIEHR